MAGWLDSSTTCSSRQRRERMQVRDKEEKDRERGKEGKERKRGRVKRKANL